MVVAVVIGAVNCVAVVSTFGIVIEVGRAICCRIIKIISIAEIAVSVAIVRCIVIPSRISIVTIRLLDVYCKKDFLAI